MATENAPSLFATDFADGLSPHHLGAIERAWVDRSNTASLRGPIGVEAEVAYAALNRLALVGALKRVFPDGPQSESRPYFEGSGLDDEFGQLIGCAEGLRPDKVNQACGTEGISWNYGQVARRNLHALFATRNMSLLMFKAVVQDVIKVPPRAPANRLRPKPYLPPRHLEVLMLHASGLKLEKIGETMQLNTRSINHSLAYLREHLGATSSAQMVYRAFESGVWQLPAPAF